MIRVAVVFLASATLAASSQPTLPSIRGRVVASIGDPLRNARVSAADGKDTKTVLTDNDGRFELGPLSRTAVTLTATKPGFAKASVKVAPVADGSIVIALQRGAAISGSVMDSAGYSVPNASVMVEAPEARDLRDARRAPVVGITDDLGRYRIGSLTPGKVLVSVFAGARSIIVLPNGAGTLSTGVVASGSTDLRRIYYPGGPSADQGEILNLEPGGEQSAIDFVVPATLPAGRRIVPAQRGQTVITGHVTDAAGRSVRGAQVTLDKVGSIGARQQITIADSDGGYQFVLAPEIGGAFILRAGQAGYLSAGYGQRSPGDTPAEIVVAPGESCSNVDIVLGRPAVVSGRIFDENGDPVEGAVVRAMRIAFSDGRRLLQPAGRALAPTDDLGQYRIAGLRPGRYVISTAVGQIIVTDTTADLPGYGETFYPGAVDPREAQAIAVGRGDDVSGMDIALARVKTARVAGRSLDSRGQPGGGALALMPSRRSMSMSSTQFGARLERDGRFEFLNVPPGDYVVQASRNRNGSWNEGESASRFVTVSGVDITDVELRTTPGSTIDGRIVAEGGELRPSDVEVSTAPVDSDVSVMLGGGPARAKIGPDLRFQLAGLHGPRRLRVSGLAAGWALKSIQHNGTDIIDTVLPFGGADESLTQIEIVVTTRVSQIAGTVVDDRNRPVPAAAVVAFAQDRSLWYPKTRYITRAAAMRDGSFVLSGVPAGSYYLGVLDTSRADDPEVSDDDPDLLDSLSAGAPRVTLDEGSHVQATVRLPRR